METDEVKALYGEFMGYLSQAPTTPQDKPYLHLDDDAIWNQYNNSVRRLSKVTGKDYGEFLIEPLQVQSGPIIRINTYRQKLGGLISRLHAEYFPELPEPFSGKPSVIINQSQQQNQSVTILLEVQSKIDEKLSKYEEGSKEKGFLEKLKSSLSTISSVTQLITTIGKIASEAGITPETIANIFA